MQQKADFFERYRSTKVCLKKKKEADLPKRTNMKSVLK